MALCVPGLGPRIAEQLAGILRQVAEDEREACARIADAQAKADRLSAARMKDIDNSFDDCAITAEVIAKAIRERKP